MTDLRAALADALGPLYRVEREVRPVGDCRLFVAREVPTGPELLVKLLPARLSLAVDSGVFEREVLLLADGGTLVADTGVVDAVGHSLTGGAVVAGAALCAPPYVAPERRDGGAPGPRDDMFAVGVLAHEMLTGQPPAPEAEPLEEVRSVPPGVAELVHRCLAPEPAGRWPDAGAALPSVNLPGGGAG